MRRTEQRGWRLLWLCGLVVAGQAYAQSLPNGDCSGETGLQGRGDVHLCEPWESDTWFVDDGFAESDRCAYSNDTPGCGPYWCDSNCEATGIPTSIESSRIVDRVSPSVPCISGNCLRITIPQGELGRFSTKYMFKENHPSGHEPEQMYMRYYIHFSEGWDSATCGNGLDGGGKLPGLGHVKVSRDPGGIRCDGGTQATLSNPCWGMRTTHKSCTEGGVNVCTDEPDDPGVPGATTQFGSYLYLYNSPASGGMNGMWHEGENHWSSFPSSGGTCDSEPLNPKCGQGTGGMFVPNRWYQVEMFVKMNTVGQANGIIRGWVDGVLSFEKTNVVFRTGATTMEADNQGNNPYSISVHVREAWLNIYMGGVQGSCDDLTIHLDQMVLAENAPIGVSGGDPDGDPDSPPAAPENLRVR